MVKRKQVGIQQCNSYCFDVKKLDQSSVHLHADDTKITCKSSVNDLGIKYN